MLSLHAEVRLADASLLPHLLKNLPHLHVMTAKRLSHCLQQPVLWSYSYWKVFIGSQRCWQSGTAGGLQGKFLWPFLGRSLRGSMYNSPLPFTMAPLWMLLSSCDSLCQSVPVCASFPLILNPQTGCDRSPILHPCVAFHGQIAAFQHLFAPFHFLQEWLAVAFFFAP